MKSKVLIGITKNLRFAIADTTSIGKLALKEILEDTFLAKTELDLITVSALLSGNVKGENTKYSIVVKGDKILGNAKVRNSSDGRIMSSSYFSQEHLTELLDSIKSNDAKKFSELYSIGEGVVYFEADYGLKYPYVTEIELNKNDTVSTIVTDYYEKSEQIPTIIEVSIKEDEDKKTIKKMGGILVQLMPNGDKKIFDKIAKKINMLHDTATILSNNFTLEQIAKLIFENVDKRVKREFIEEYKILKTIELEYTCDCTREKFQDLLIRATSKEELINILKEDGKIEAVCSFCNKPYIFLDEKEIYQTVN